MTVRLDPPLGPLPSLYAIHGTATDDVWAVGWDGSIVHWDGRAWSHTKTGTDKPLGGVRAIARDDAWAFGLGGALLHWNGDSWIRHIAAAVAVFWRAWANGPDDVWAIVHPHQVARWDGERWNVMRFADLHKNAKIMGVWGSAGDDVWLVGSQLFHWDGRTLELHYSPDVFGTLRAVHGFGPSDVWAVGDHGMVAHFDGTKWHRVQVPIERTLNAVWGSGADDLWVAGEGGVVGHWNGREWSVEILPGAPTIMDIWGASADEVWAVTFDGRILRRAGGAWMVVEGDDPQPPSLSS